VGLVGGTLLGTLLAVPTVNLIGKMDCESNPNAGECGWVGLYGLLIIPIGAAAGLVAGAAAGGVLGVTAYDYFQE
jgi:hypothetical protein